jgi:hypothetical protein
MATAATLTTINGIGVVLTRHCDNVFQFTATATDTATFVIPCNRLTGCLVHDITNNALRIATITQPNAVSVAGVQLNAVHNVYAFGS